MKTETLTILDMDGMIQPPIIQKWRYKVMLDYDYTKEYGLPMDKSLRTMRINKCPIQLSGNIVVADQLETSGRIRIFENTGKTLYLLMDDCDIECNTNISQVAEIRVSVLANERKVKLDGIYCEYGHNDELVPVLLEQVMNFADFYNYEFSVTDSRKEQQKLPKFSKGSTMVDMIF